MYQLLPVHDAVEITTGLKTSRIDNTAYAVSCNLLPCRVPLAPLRFIQEGTFFDNYYVTPQCAQSRAAMLTGRYSARVGTMLVNGAWDFINSNEVTAAKLLDSENYATAQFGKW
jgi:arylsulfatase A-like enzyme